MRLVPAFLKGRKDSKDQEHEYRMAQLQLESTQTKGDQELESASILGQMAAYRDAIKGQSQLTNVRWVDAVNATVRPFITYWWQALFTIYKVCIIVWAWDTANDLKAFADVIWTPNDMGILSMILGFWFVDRALKHQDKK